MAISLPLECIKKEVLESIQCYEGSVHYEEYEDLYEELLLKHKAILQPIGYFTFRDNFKPTDIENSGDMASCENPDFEKLACCLITLSDQIVQRMDEYFAESDYMSGVLLNGMADVVLFNASLRLYEHVHLEAQSKGLKLSKRLEPGNGSTILEAQAWILESINKEEDTHVTITSGYMLNPKKSVGYFYGAGQSLPFNVIDHDCSLCDCDHCPYRKVYLTVKDKGHMKSARTVSNHTPDLILRVAKGSNLLGILQENKLPISADCAGNSTCGKCKVKVIGQPRVLSDREKTFLTPKEVEDGFVLACFHHLDTDLTIELIDDNQDGQKSQILADFDYPPLTGNKYQQIQVDGIFKSPHMNESATDLLNLKLNQAYSYSLAAVRQLSRLKMDTSFYALVKDQAEVVAFDTQKDSFYGIAIDIGTTTIAIALVNVITGAVVSVEKAMNPQKSYGADVISRIQYATEHPDHPLKEVVQTTLLKGIQKLIKKHHIKEDLIVEMAIAGNTTMHYLIAGIDPKALAVSPFLTMHMDQITLSFAEFFQDLLLSDSQGTTPLPRLSCNCVLLPGLSAYIGGDILSGVYGTDMNRQEGNILFIDIGTNGELVIKNNQRMISVATAAGPAFEGANITCGMGSLKGAISRAEIDPNQPSGFDLQVIGGGTPKGICGSGLIDLIALSLERELVDDTGHIEDGEEISLYAGDLHADHDSKEGKKAGGTSNIYLTQKDIRELQLAKAAIAAGIEVLLEECGCTVDTLDQVLLAGGFGHYLNIKNAVRIGLLPSGIEAKTKVVGNSSLGGCVRFLLDRSPEDSLARIKAHCEYIELSTHGRFNDIYIDKMMFE